MTNVGGLILFPPSLSRSGLIALTLQSMELAPGEFKVRLPEEGFPRFAGEGYPFRTEEPVERALALLAQEESGVIEGMKEKEFETYWLEPGVASAPVLTIWVNDSSMFYDTRASQVESFARRWPHLCEQSKAIFGYFSPFEFMFDRDYLEERMIPALERGDLAELMHTRINWLIYLGPELAQRWRQEQTPFPAPPLISQELPSGAHFFRTRTEVFA